MAMPNAPFVDLESVRVALGPPVSSIFDKKSIPDLSLLDLGDLDWDDLSDDEQAVQQAVAFIRHQDQSPPAPPDKPLSHRSIMFGFGAPRTTTQARLKGRLYKPQSNAYKRHFTPAEDNILIDLLVQSAERGFPLTEDRLRDTANHLLLVKHAGNHIVSDISDQHTLYDNPELVENAPQVGVNWPSRWLHMHHDKVQKYWSRTLDAQRAKALNPENVREWFSLLRQVYVREGDKVDGEEEGVMTEDRIYSMDETCGWGDTAASERVIGGRGKKNQYFVRPTSRESTTLIVSTCADGRVLRPFCIFAASALRQEWISNNPLNAA
jgi:hypothetical protein